MPEGLWYRTWFNSPYYHILYRKRDESEAALFIDRILKYFTPPEDSKFLDLACGKGRYSIYIHKKKFEVTGVDLAADNIRKAKKFETDGLHFSVHDMRQPCATEKFDYVFNLFTSFGYFPSVEENEAVLYAAHQALKPKGFLLIDFLNAEKVIHNLVIEERQTIEGIHFDILRKHENGQIIKEIEIDDKGKKYNFKEEVKALTHTDFAGMLKRTGFEIRDTFGSYLLTAFNARVSPRLIIIARKTA